MRRSTAAAAILALVLLPGAASPARAQPVPAWEAFAIRYATVPRFPTSALIAGSDTSRRTDLAMMVWLLRGPGGRTVLVDAGFKREDLIARWKPVGYVRPDSAVARAGVKPSEVTDIIVSHIHWDHFDGVDLFPNARLWIQREEVEHHISATGAVLDRSIDGPDAAMLHALRAAGRVALVDGDAKEIIPGITVYTGGKHTYQSQYAAVRTAAGTVVIASDNAYLFENLERHVPIAQTLDAASNLSAQERMAKLASSPRLIVPGHDPLVFERFERVAPDVVRLVPMAPAGHDAYPRQPIDVEHYRFALRLADSTDRIVGDATVRLRILSPGLTTVTLDLASATPARQGRGMRVSAVSRHGHELRFSHANDRLAITLDSAAPAGEVIELAVHYDGIPADGLQVKPNKYADRSFFSDNWPDKARHWLPVIDHISDKATMEMEVVAPVNYQVISNGRRVEETDLPGGQRRTVWRESVPIAPWLYALGVARFAVQDYGEYHGVPLSTWVFAQDRDAGFFDFAVPARDVLSFYSERIGPFSYEKLANVQSNSVSGGMEAASAIFYSSGSVTGTRPLRWRNVVIHEIAHQWFGNAVTEADWNDVWLSEGFATYFTLLFIEHAYGRDEFTAGLRESRKTVLDFYAKTPDYRVVHEHLADMSQVTSSMTYQKGSWVLHMLRQAMGDDRFWAGIRDYYARYRDGNASTADFRVAMERASGLDLAPFFQQWLYRGGVPLLEGTWRWDAATKAVVVDLRQLQPGEPFSLAVEFGIAEAGAKPRVERAEMTGRSGRFTFHAEQEPAGVELDPNVKLLAAGLLVRR